MKLAIFSAVAILARARSVTKFTAAPELPVPQHEVCGTAIAIRFGETSTNRQCIELCNSIITKGIAVADFDSDESWKGRCQLAHFTSNGGRVRPDNTCFSNWIFGYSDPSVDAAYNRHIFKTDTPALCQTACQEDDQCVNWAWVSPTRGSEHAKTCFLKNLAQLQFSTFQSTQSNALIDTRYCNSQMIVVCPSHHYECNPCIDDKLRCVWRSDQHIAGWKGCMGINVCAWDGSAERTDGPSSQGSQDLPLPIPTSEPPATLPTTIPTTPQSTLPGHQTTLPGQQTTLPGQQTTLPGQQTTLPGQQTTLPGQQTTLPGNQPSLPTDVLPEAQKAEQEQTNRNNLFIGAAAGGAAIIAGGALAARLLRPGPSPIDADFAGEETAGTTVQQLDMSAQAMEEDFAA